MSYGPQHNHQASDDQIPEYQRRPWASTGAQGERDERLAADVRRRLHRLLYTDNMRIEGLGVRGAAHWRSEQLGSPLCLAGIHLNASSKPSA